MTGQRIGDEYFTKLYDLRNEEAKMVRNGTSDDPTAKAQQSHNGCESVNNDTRSNNMQDDSCESIPSQP